MNPPTPPASPEMETRSLKPGDKVVDHNGFCGVIVADLTADLTYEPGSYECDMGHGYLVVRHASELEHEEADKCPTCGNRLSRVDYHGFGKRCYVCNTIS